MLVLKNRLSLMISAIPDLPEIGPFLVQRLTKQHDPEHIWILGLQLAGSSAEAFSPRSRREECFGPCFVSCRRSMCGRNLAGLAHFC